MDKDSIILKYHQEELKDAEKDLHKVQEDNEEQAAQLDALADKLKEAYALLGKEPPQPKKGQLRVVESAQPKVVENTKAKEVENTEPRVEESTSVESFLEDSELGDSTPGDSTHEDSILVGPTLENSNSAGYTLGESTLVGPNFGDSTSIVVASAKSTPEESLVSPPHSYDEIFEKAKRSLVERGLDVENLDYHDLVSESELQEIMAELNRPLPRREKWTKSDFIVIFIAASIGSLADIILGDRNNKLTGQNSAFSDWLNQFHKHDSGGPIDYQGKGFGGPYHRGLSRGHDILRFIEGIMMFKRGEFVGIRYENGQAIEVISRVNQYGNPYEQLPTIEAIVKYAQHMFGDLFSTCSLPFPGSSFLAESDSRTLRKFAADMYQNGFNIKNVIIQSLTTIIIEVIIRIYYSIQSVKQYKDEIELAEDYSNFEAFKRFIKPTNKEKLHEMLLVAHAIVTAVNVGKVVIKKAPWEINITEIIAVIRYGIKVLKNTRARHSEYAKLMRNVEEIHQRWQEFEAKICYDCEEVAKEITEVLVIE